MKNLAISFALILTAGCAPAIYHDTSPNQSFRLKNSDELLIIGGSLVNKYSAIDGSHISKTLSITINAETVILGDLNHDFKGTISAKWHDHFIDANCNGSRKSPSWVEVRCTVHVDNERAATLTF